MVVVIDNYDSFVYNIVQYLGELGWQPKVFRNDRVCIKEIEKLTPSHIIISPGPCTPHEAGISNEVVMYFSGRVPLLGICLGHQCIGYVHGGKIVAAPVPMHGKTSLIYHDGQRVYQGLPNPFESGRYHSLAVNGSNLPTKLIITAKTSDGVIMGIRHREYVVEGLQFHPESIMTEVGHDILSNFLNYLDPNWPKE